MQSVAYSSFTCIMGQPKLFYYDAAFVQGVE